MGGAGLSGWLPWLGGAAALLGALWALLRVFRAWMRTEARAAADGLYERLKANDFRHVEDGLKALGERMDRMGSRTEAMEARIGERLERIEARRREEAAAMERRIVEAVAGRPRPGPESAPEVRESPS